jgi:hypothetical protein
VIFWPDLFLPITFALLILSAFFFVLSKLVTRSQPPQYTVIKSRDTKTISERDNSKRQNYTEDYIGPSLPGRIFRTPLSSFRMQAFRSFIMLQTYLSIFAVDFMLYPVRFIKTEYLGISLMDVGVGCYI